MIRIKTLLRPLLWFLYLMLAFEVVLAVLPLAVRFVDSIREPEPPRRPQLPQGTASDAEGEALNA